MNRRAAALVALFAAPLALAPVVAAPDPVVPKPASQAPDPAARKPAPADPKAAPVTPTPLAGTASGTAPLAQPKDAPFVVPKATGKMEIPAGQKTVRVEAQVSKDHPTSYSFTSPGGNQFFWVGVSSPKSDVYLSAFDHETKQPIAGTAPTDKAARVLLSFKKPTELLFVAHTDSAGTPFRFEVTLGGMSL